ncbi:MAG: FHA domain-containing protein [Anaerolineaceae bacterium]|nr:FHA domain-containing protein [Anaerolineaceae bacterium]
MDEYVEISIDVFDQARQRARVKRSLTVGGLIDEILKEFDDLDIGNPDIYALFLKGQDRPLDKYRSLNDLDIQIDDEFSFLYAMHSPRDNIAMAEKSKAILRVDATGELIEIKWQPALIGRPDNDPAHNELLALNMQTVPGGLNVSRKHAQITQVNNRYFLESLSAYNPTFINNEVGPIQTQRALNSGDVIYLGQNKVPITFLQD